MLQERGRWLSPTSLRTYVDVVTAVTVNIQFDTANLREAVRAVQGRFEHYFPEHCFAWAGAGHAAPRQQKGARRPLPHRGETPPGGIAGQSPRPARPTTGASRSGSRRASPPGASASSGVSSSPPPRPCVDVARAAGSA